MFVNIDNSPSLVYSVMSVPHDNLLAFSILSLIDIKNLSVSDIVEVASSVLEDLPPSRLGAIDSHLSRFSIGLDIPRLIVVSCLDSQRSLIEIPNLCSSSVSNLDNHVSVVNNIKVSSRSHMCDNMEISLNVETEVFVELSLGWFSLPLIMIDNIELLINLSMFFPDNEVSVFFINSSVNINNLSSLVLNESSSSIEKLPPS